ncbi:MAG: aminotransferase class I/II-fold pyridoxal phosphate-dependent enzyme [Candidatus Limnocylindria bacterium]
MRLPTFEMERMQSTWEHRVRFDLSESGVEALTLAEAVGDVSSLAGVRLGYAAGMGREETRAQVAAFHAGADAKNVLITTGTSEANFLALLTLVDPGDDVVVVLPNYMQVHGLARTLGARVREVWLREDKGWSLDLEELSAVMGSRTKAVCVCTPNNPTGQILSREDVASVAEIAERHGTWVLSDEVYRGTEHAGDEAPSFWGSGERVIVTGGLSKAYGLPGLRIGWIVSSPERIDAAWAAKDYTTIAPATLSDLLAEKALARRAQLLERARSLLRERWPVLREWAGRQNGALRWTEPQAGAVCFFAYGHPVDSIPLADRLRAEGDTMVVPGAHFIRERHLRLGFGMDRRTLDGGLAALDRCLRTFIPEAEGARA